jgi:predicted PurR-regulated permease PerM
MIQNNTLPGNNQIRRTVETTIKIAVLFVLLYWCYGIVKPFTDILVWSVIFAVAIYPMYSWLAEKLGGRKKLSASLVVTLMLLIIIIPGLLFAKSMFEGVTFLTNQYESGGISIPEASEKVAAWPVVGPVLYEKWNWISHHAAEAFQQYTPQIKQLIGGLISSIASATGAFLKLIISMIIAGTMLVSSESAGRLAHEVFTKLIGEKGMEFASMAEKTIRTVIKGIVGVAFIQSFLFGIGMVVAGVPAAGLWVILSLILGIVQIGIFPISIPIIIYVFATKSTGIAVIFLIWTVVVSPIDNVLKPIFLGKGAAVPMPVIFIGAIGGFIFSGLVGLFTGAIVFSIGYKLFLFWLEENKTATE